MRPMNSVTPANVPAIFQVNPNFQPFIASQVPIKGPATLLTLSLRCDLVRTESLPIFSRENCAARAIENIDIRIPKRATPPKNRTFKFKTYKKTATLSGKTAFRISKVEEEAAERSAARKSRRPPPPPPPKSPNDSKTPSKMQNIDNITIGAMLRKPIDRSPRLNTPQPLLPQR